MEIHDELLISYLLEETSAAQRQQVENWLEAAPANRQHFHQFALVWRASRQLEVVSEVDPLDSLARFRRAHRTRQQTGSKVFLMTRRSMIMKAAAALILLAGTVWWLWPIASQNEFTRTIAHATVQKDTLPDGSVVTLNRSAILRHPVAFQQKYREVFLEKGEAFFRIRHLQDQPFILHAGKADIQVLGTSFNVKRKEGSVEVIVESGLVSVTQSGQTLRVSPNQKLVVFEDGRKPISTIANGKLYQYYRTKVFVADDTPLKELVVVLNEAYGSNIVIRNPKLDQLRLNTTFRDESLDVILDIISRTLQISVIRTPDAIILK